MKTKLTSMLLILFIMSGCASLITQNDDSVPAKAGKVTSRIGLGIITLGLSENIIADNYNAKWAESICANGSSDDCWRAREQAIQIHNNNSAEYSNAMQNTSNNLNQKRALRQQRALEQQRQAEQYQQQHELEKIRRGVDELNRKLE